MNYTYDGHNPDKRRPTKNAIDGALDVLESSWRDVSAEGESVHAVCREVRELRAENARLVAELEFYKGREAHFRKVLAVSDGGRYRADWDSRIQQLVEENRKHAYSVPERPLCEACAWPLADDDDNGCPCESASICSSCDALCWSEFGGEHRQPSRKKTAAMLVTEAVSKAIAVADSVEEEFLEKVRKSDGKGDYRNWMKVCAAVARRISAGVGAALSPLVSDAGEIDDQAPR